MALVAEQFVDGTQCRALAVVDVYTREALTSSSASAFKRSTPVDGYLSADAPCPTVQIHARRQSSPRAGFS
jgi:hypothetical protein